MAFLEDPRLRQRWNQITHDTETITENAAAGIWTFQHNYINPCFSSIAHSFEQCTAVCLGDPEERLRRRRERELSHGRAEYSFDFYDDWYEEEQGGLFGAWGNEDWDRLLAGTGSSRKHNGAETTEQPRRKRGMSYGTRDRRRKPSMDDDPTVIPKTQPIGFLSKLPWKVGGTLRYKPSAADLQDHPHRHGAGENEPLLHSNDGSDLDLDRPVTRKRSGTTGSGDTSDSYRSRGDLFPSDGEGEEDAVPLDDEVTYDMVRKDDRSGRSARTSSKGKRPAGGLAGSRTVSRTTLGSCTSKDDFRLERRSTSQSATTDVEDTPTLHDLEREEYLLRKEEDEAVERKKQAAAQLAAEKGLAVTRSEPRYFPDTKPQVTEDDVYEASPSKTVCQHVEEVGDTLHVSKRGEPERAKSPQGPDDTEAPEKTEFVPARLPHF
ncbi:hypothetical protein HYE67_004149 [Fusarium culmorum]|uniref:Uncharacterized protein n=1 Tax=Fusarium culmorum TaxID=5516 RepID=A0A2T4GKA5_FUSCU|nr:hypothetical protein FCULG_00001343 [Fusarium culmorum]QPC61918.1 hypothetical protein HYE67_004149 [Fusarium culmorum]